MPRRFLVSRQPAIDAAGIARLLGDAGVDLLKAAGARIADLLVATCWLVAWLTPNRRSFAS